MMRARPRVVLLLVVAAAAAGALIALLTPPKSHRADQACGAVGCTFGVSLEIQQLPEDLPRARKIDVCVAGQCQHDAVYEAGPPRGQHVPKPFPSVSDKAGHLHGPGPYLVSVTVRDRGGHVLLRAERSVKMERVSPNGDVCGPTCFVRGLRLDVASRTLEILPRGKV